MVGEASSHSRLFLEKCWGRQKLHAALPLHGVESPPPHPSVNWGSTVFTKISRIWSLGCSILFSALGIIDSPLSFPPCRRLSRHCYWVALQAARRVKDAETQASLLYDRLKPLKILEENLSRNLSEIKLLISQARKQAASVSVGSWGSQELGPPAAGALGNLRSQGTPVEGTVTLTSTDSALTTHISPSLVYSTFKTLC